mmetsp:Transcript_72936/g.201293  ORF Transcript_72936/g.201293 Transcript_72936/m.201293 type:complete len:250 (-) Transcript_72936:157-906(-)
MTSPRGPSESLLHKSRNSPCDLTRKPKFTEGFSRDQRSGNGRPAWSPALVPALRTSSIDSSAGCTLCGSKKSRQSSCVPTKKCAEDALFPLARPWNSGSSKQLSMPGRYSAALKASRPRRRQMKIITVLQPPAKSSITLSLKMAPSSKTTQPTPRRKFGARGASASGAAQSVAAAAAAAVASFGVKALKRWPTACAAEVGPNHAEGSLPRSCWPVATRRCSEKGARGTSRKQETTSRYGEPAARSRSAS